MPRPCDRVFDNAPQPAPSIAPGTTRAYRPRSASRMVTTEPTIPPIAAPSRVRTGWAEVPGIAPLLRAEVGLRPSVRSYSGRMARRQREVDGRADRRLRFGGPIRVNGNRGHVPMSSSGARLRAALARGPIQVP